MGRFFKAQNKVIVFFVWFIFLLLTPFLVVADNLNNLEWVKNELPILDLGQSGSWDGDVVFYPTVLRQNSNLIMIYAGIHKSNRWYEEIGYANSTDGINWTKYASNPVLRVGSSWESYQLSSSSLYVDSNLEYRLWYSGYDGGINTAIGYATSSDCLSWTKYSSNPVLTRGNPGSWDDRFIDMPFVIKEDGIYKMWYEGASPLNAGAPGKGGIGFATSIDGISWNKYFGNPVFNRSEADVRPNILKDGYLYYMFFRCDPDLGEGTGICYATSPNGINWNISTSGPILTAGPAGAWDSARVDQPFVLKKGDGFEMWYTGYDSSGKGRIGYAYTRPKAPVCPNEPEQKILESLNNYPYDFYNEYYDYNDNATSPDTIKQCYTEVDENDTWMIRVINGSYAMYPIKASFIGPDIGLDFNTWYDWSTLVKTPIPGENRNVELKYPEFEARIIDKRAKTKEDNQSSSLTETLLNAGEFSLTTGGLYYKGPIERVNATRAEVLTEFNGTLRTPVRLERLTCDATYKDYYDSDTETFSSDGFGEFGCSGSTHLSDYQLSYLHDLSFDLGLLSYNGSIVTELNFTPELEAGVNIKLLPPNAYVVGGKTNVQFTAGSETIGTFCKGDICAPVNRTIELPEVSEFTAVSEMVGPFDNFTGKQGVKSMLPRISDGKTVEYRNLISHSPVFRIEGSEITVKANICLNISDLKIPCQNLNCIKCLHKGEVLKVKPWELYAGETKIIVHSPVQIHVYDEFGNHAGINSTGGFDNQIEGSKYYEEGEAKILSFTTNTDRFFVLLNGTDNGTYRMEIHRPIRIETGNEIIFQEVSYSVGPIETNLSKIDYYSFDFDEIERLVNLKVSQGEEIASAISEALEETVAHEENLPSGTKPTLIQLEDLVAYPGETINLTARLLSFSSPLEGNAIDFYLDSLIIGNNVTNRNGDAQIIYTLPSNIALGTYPLKASFAGNEDLLYSESSSKADILNLPPIAYLDAPSYAKGIVRINGTIKDSNLKSQEILIDDLSVSSDLAYEWNTTGQDGVHTIELKAEDEEGETASAFKLVFVDNTPPVVLISEPREGISYLYNVTPDLSVDEIWLKELTLLVDELPYEKGAMVLGQGNHTFEVNATDYLNHSTYRKINFAVYDLDIVDVKRAGNDNKAGSLVVLFVIYNGKTPVLESSIIPNLDGNPMNEVPSQVCNREGNLTKCLYKFRATQPGTYSIDAKVNGIMIGENIEEFYVRAK